MSDDDRIFALADKRFPSLDSLHAWFTAQIAGTKDEDLKADLRLADQVATQRHLKREKAAANAPIPTPPPTPKPPPEPLPPDASDDERATRMYGPTRMFGAAPSQPSAAKADLSPDEHAAQDEAAAELYGSAVIGMSLAAVRPKVVQAENTEEVHVKKVNLSKARQHERGMNKKFEAMQKKQPAPERQATASKPHQEET